MDWKQIMDQNPPKVHTIMGLHLYVGWDWKGCGFGELYLSFDPEKNEWVACTEGMGPQSIRKILHAAADKIADDLIANNVFQPRKKDETKEGMS